MAKVIDNPVRLHVRNFVYCYENEKTLAIANDYIQLPYNVVTNSMINIVKQDISDDIIREHGIFLHASYLGFMSSDELENFDEPINQQSESAYFYLLTFRSLTKTFATIVSKSTPMITKPTIARVRDDSKLDGYVLVAVEPLGLMTTDEFNNMDSELIK